MEIETETGLKWNVEMETETESWKGRNRNWKEEKWNQAIEWLTYLYPRV